MKKWLVSLMVISLIGGFVMGCHKNQEASSETIDIIEDEYIVRNNRSEYNILVPENAKTKELVAAENLSTYMQKSTGVKMNIIYDNKMARGNKYISLGGTTLFKELFADKSMSELDNKISSYFIATKGSNIYIYSNPKERSEAITYGVMDLLHELINYEYYAQDEIYYTKENTINLRNYKDMFVHPSFDGRSVGNYYLINNQSLCDNLRMINQYRGTEWASELYGHSQITKFVKPKDLYDGSRTVVEAHPEWFSNPSAADGRTNQLCWTAGEELESYVASRFIYFIQKYPEAIYFMFGQEDNSSAYCNCPKCKHALEEYGVNYAGLQIVFMNHVIEKVEAWLAEHQPDRQVRYVVYAYYFTKDAPCVEKNGQWKAANNLVIPHEKLYIFYAPITCNFGFPLDNNYFNSDTYLELKQWNEVANGHVIIYFYDTNFQHYFSNFYNFGTVKSMYQACKDFGVTYMYTQGACDAYTTAFTDMRQYVESKLMWDLRLDYEELVKDFMNHYFRDAAPDLYEYYQTVRDRLVEYHATHLDGGGIYTNIANKDLYPYTVLRYYSSLFDKAMDKIDHYQMEDPEFYSLLKARIMKEYLSVIYLMMTVTKADVSEDDKARMKEIFSYYTSYYGITIAREGGTLIDIEELFS